LRGVRAALAPPVEGEEEDDERDDAAQGVE
jgi:hypothetical protein